MNEIKVKDILEITNAKLICGNEEEVLENFKKDTKEIEKGDTYVGIRGENTEGSIFFQKAFENGAKACIIQNIEIEDNIIKRYKDRIIIKVENSVKALQEIAKYKRDMYNIPVIRDNRKCRKNKY